ncbi:hypothetical protein DHEL01_v200919 [Diaporthe helianthi]|uniref:Uncharacterized protein n=1 Tax=Diaporthe helianthi TaxID=158607 RepID=A0A2P5IDT7_DIAHE|nr:hypothetical protein DHEL01_v200919 [Diaporthe helianthi]
MSDRYGQSSARRNPRRKSRYESSEDEGHPAVYSEKHGDSDSGGSYIPASTASSRRRSSSRSQHHQHHSHQGHRRDPSHRSHSQWNHERNHRHRHHRRQELLGPAEDDEKPREGGMAVAIREEYAVQTVPRVHHPHADDSADEEEEVYDHRPKPVSHRSHSHVGVSTSGRRQASNADKGFFMAAAALAVSLIICCDDADND